MVSKFPVTSENGNEYQVTIYEDGGWNTYVASVYTQKKLFGKWNRRKRVSGGMYEGRYGMKDWDYDLVRISKHAVRKYEKSINDQLLHKQRKAESLKKFDDWDGKIQ